MASAFDIHFQLGTSGSSERQFTFGFASAAGVRGFQKTINQWLKCLMTQQGSDPRAKRYGTQFPGLIGSNTFGPGDVSERVTMAVQDATAQILAIQRAMPAAELPDDERLASGTVYQIQQTGPTDYAVYVVLRNVQNQGINVLLPTF